MIDIEPVSINTDTSKYAARAWRTGILREEAAKQITKMLQAFVPKDFVVKIEECNSEVPGFPHAPNYKYRATLRDSRIDGSDAHIYVEGYSWNGVQARLLALIIEGRGFFPMT